MLEDITKRVYRFKKTCRFLGRIETIEGYRYMPFEVTNHETGRVYKGRLPLTKLPAALKEGVLHIGKYNQLVPFDLINDWVCGVMV